MYMFVTGLKQNNKVNEILNQSDSNTFIIYTKYIIFIEKDLTQFSSDLIREYLEQDVFEGEEDGYLGNFNSIFI